MNRSVSTVAIIALFLWFGGELVGGEPRVLTEDIFPPFSILELSTAEWVDDTFEGNYRPVFGNTVMYWAVFRGVRTTNSAGTLALRVEVQDAGYYRLWFRARNTFSNSLISVAVAPPPLTGWSGWKSMRIKA